MLQYALLHLFNYAVTLDDLKAFRVSLLCLSSLKNHY
jgi:transketolase